MVLGRPVSATSALVPLASPKTPRRGKLFVTNEKTATITILSDASVISATTSTASSSLAFQRSYAAVVAINVALILLLGGLTLRRTKTRGSGH